DPFVTILCIFFFNFPPPSEIYTLSLHDALPISERFIGIHFMNPVPLMELVELIRGIATDDVTFDTTKQYVAKLGKTIAMAEDFRSEEHTSELQSRSDLVCRLLLEKKKKKTEIKR